MGTSANMTTSNSHVLYHITINQNSQNVANNTSNVSVFVNFWRDNSYTTYGSGTVYCKINGTTYSASVSPSQTITSSGIDLFSKTLDIGHNADGTKTLVTSAWISLDTPLTSSEQSYSQTLTTIPRASSISGISGNTFGSSVTVSISRASSSFKHNVFYKRPDGTWFTVGTNIDTSCTFTPGLADCQYVTNSTASTVTIKVDTYYSGSYVGTASTNTTFYAPSSVVPTIDSVTLSEAVSGISSKFGGYVQGKSKITASISASGIYNSTISSYSSSTNSQSFSSASFTTNELVNSGSQSVSTTVTDSRGRTASATTSYTALAYANPTITTFTVARANSSGVLDDQGTYVLCTINATIANVNDLNDKSFKIKYKKVSDSTYTEIDITPSGTTYSYNTTYLVSGISGDYEYNFMLELTDYFTTVTNTQNIPTAFTLMDFNLSGKGIAFGKVSAMDGFEVEMPAVFGDTVEVDGVITPSGGFDHVKFVADTDFNDVKTPNIYVGNRASYTFTNAPTYSVGTESFTLDVFYGGTSGDAGVAQRYTGLNKSVPYVWQRYYYSDTWGSWNAIYDYGKFLYSNSSGTSGTITLSESSANFSYVDIYFWGDGMDIIRVYSPNGQKAALFSGNVSGGTMYQYYAGLTFSGTSVTWSNHYWIWGTSTFSVASTSNGKVRYIVGYR